MTLRIPDRWFRAREVGEGVTLIVGHGLLARLALQHLARERVAFFRPALLASFNSQALSAAHVTTQVRKTAS